MFIYLVFHSQTFHSKHRNYVTAHAELLFIISKQLYIGFIFSASAYFIQVSFFVFIASLALPFTHHLSSVNNFLDKTVLMSESCVKVY